MPNPFYTNNQFYFKHEFVKTFLRQTIQFSISIDFVNTQLNIKTVLFQTIQFSINTQFYLTHR